MQFERPDLWTDQAGTIDDLIDDAVARGFPATRRLIHDWVQIGLLDHPQRRTRGGSGGSDKALWPWTQRNLFRLLAEKRPGVKSVWTLCNVPVGLWLLWGADYVPAHQVQVALQTWAGSSVKVSWTTARRQARQLTDFLDDLDATRGQRSRLIEALATVAYNGPAAALDLHDIVEDIFDVFDPDHQDRPMGAPGAAVTAHELVSMLESRARGLLAAKTATVQQLEQVRILFHNSQAEYLAQRPQFEAQAYRPEDAAVFSQPPTYETLINQACSSVCAILGLTVEVEVT